MDKRTPRDSWRSSPAPHPAQQARLRVPWKSLEQQVALMQKQIALAGQCGDTQTVHRLQQQLIESEAARLLAVRRVTEESQGKHTAGVDGVKSLTPQERLAMTSAIHPQNWTYQQSAPARHVWIPKRDTDERRPLAILPMIDRCKQMLVKLALEPEWEMCFEPHSYGFRPGRGTHDAIAAIVVALERSPTFVFNTDIARAFDDLNQAVILEKLETYPALREAIASWLKVGVIDGGAYSPSDTGIPQGGALSPLLMNVALHGLETVAATGPAREPPLLVRYADNFVVLHTDLGVLQQAVRRVRSWLAALGLQLHAEKTHLAHTLTPFQGQRGFDFLGFHLHQEPRARKGEQERTLALKTVVVPSQEASTRHLAAIDRRLQRWQTASQARVIAELNPLILGWAAYYNGMVEASTMSKYDDLLEQRLLWWASLRHPCMARDWLLACYWQPEGKHSSIFATPEGAALRTYQQRSILKGEW